METWVQVLQGDPTARESFLKYLDKHADALGAKAMQTKTDLEDLRFTQGQFRVYSDLHNLITSTKEVSDG